MADNWDTKVLLTIREVPKGDDQGQGFGMWLLHYIKDGKSISVKVVCGNFTTDPGTGEKRYYAKGMGIRDFDTLRPKWKEVEALMKNPPAIAGPESGDAGTEEAPF